MSVLSATLRDALDSPSPSAGSIATKPIGQLASNVPGKQMVFRIPEYQRGYRWKKNDVTRLLEDLQEFLDEYGNGGGRPFYCLQPLVVKKPNNSNPHADIWEVVDGQQRLTTIFLIWKFLTGSAPYTLEYVTRERSEAFLQSPAENDKVKNIDFHHIYHAHQAIIEWFKGAESRMESFRELLADTSPDGRNVRCIWYELREQDAVAAFTRLNVGKIPLTDEELIRALFLRSPDGGKVADGAFRHRLALEWNRIETALHDADFWGFLSKDSGPEGGRIRLLFEICAPQFASASEHELFLHYEVLLKTGGAEATRAEWQKIVACFEQLEEWYCDPELFHHIGFLVTTVGGGGGAPSTKLKELLQLATRFTKSAYTGELRRRIRSQLIGADSTISEFIQGLTYSDRAKTRQTLALFNIATLLRTKGVCVRFPFYAYHGNDWDIEHVQSQAGDALGDRKRQLEWLELCELEMREEVRRGDISDESECLQNLDRIEHLDRIDQFKKGNQELSFEDLSKMIRTYFGESDQGDGLDNIRNLTLLDCSTNRGYGNAPFAVKRSILLKRDREGAFVLPCTRDLFLKVFSPKPGNLRRWDIDTDGKAHEEEICHTLEAFFRESRT